MKMQFQTNLAMDLDALLPVHSQLVYPSNQASKWWCLPSCCERFRDSAESTSTEELLEDFDHTLSLVNAGLRFVIPFHTPKPVNAAGLIAVKNKQLSSTPGTASGPLRKLNLMEFFTK